MESKREWQHDFQRDGMISSDGHFISGVELVTVSEYPRVKAIKDIDKLCNTILEARQLWEKKQKKEKQKDEKHT